MVAAVIVLSIFLAGCGSRSDPYGATKFTPHYPAFLPKKALDASTDRVLTGTAARPALTVEGDGVEVKTPHWSVLAQVQGPAVPGEGLPYQRGYTTCTWTITMSHATGTVPLSLADFNSIDHLGQIYHLHLVQGQPGPPAVVRPGQTVVFEVRSYEAVGEGLMRWAPLGQRIVAEWDYEVEND
jgi:hypothetical protein